ncbi:hypothetical protein FQN54_009900 [Arachnomyces sp. PD_36]|nr:hypothetical protein FQN54_009900 [Arachnomyces sp. PD_36]
MALQSAVDGHDRHPRQNDEPDLSNEDRADDSQDQDQEPETDLNDDLEQPPPDDQSAHDCAVDAFLRPLQPDDATLYRLACSFSDLYRDLARTSDQQFLPTPVTSLPSGHETGRYLAIDVGGSNLRVAFIELLGDSVDDCSDNGAGTVTPERPASGRQRKERDGTNRSQNTLRKARRQRVRRTLEKTWPIGEHLKMDKAEDLFSWIGDCIAEVVANSLTADVAADTIPEELEMGITFSFPMMQDSLAEATLMPMGKGFGITSDLNLRNILLAGYERHTRRPYAAEQPTAKRRRGFALPKLKIAAITNDTVATLASLAYSVKSLPNSRVAMGIIVGTGCNATIPMKLADLHESKAKHVSSRHPDAVETIVNTEWTINGAAPPLHEQNITTKWDVQLDKACARPGFQPFEYMTGGRYIGELVRLVLFDYLTNEVGLQQKDLPGNLIQEYALTTSFLSHVVARGRSAQAVADELTQKLPPPESSQWSWDARSAGVFQKIARAVQTRSAGLIAAAVVGLLSCTSEIQLNVDSANNPTPPPETTSIVPPFNGVPPSTSTESSNPASSSTTTTVPIITGMVPNLLRQGQNGPIVPILSPPPYGWESGPEELVVAYTGGIIQNYPHFKETCQRYIDRLVMRGGPQESGKSVFLREASDGGIIGAGVLAGMVAGG